MPGVSLGAFELCEPIGSGGFGSVWRARHVRSGLEVAVKRLHTAAEDGGRAFRREVRAVARLAHPHVVRVYDHGETEAGEPWLAMELAPLGTLHERAARMPWREVRAVLLQVLAALAHAHARGVVHRDVKPSNVLLAAPSEIRLTDFGLAFSAAAGGSLPFMAPEQFRDEPAAIGPWTDLYALGCTAWQLVCGAPPFPSTTAAEARQHHAVSELPPLTPAVPVPEGLERWLAALLEKDPYLRVAFAADAAAALRELGDPVEPVCAVVVPTAASAATWSLDEVADVPIATSPAAPRLPPVPVSDRFADAGEYPQPAPLADAGASLFALRPWVVTGWRAERERLWQELVGVAREGRARVVALRGHPDQGADWLARWLAETGHEQGACDVLHVSHGLVDSVVRWLGGDERTIHRRLGRSEVPEPWVAPGLREGRLAAVAEALRLASLERPLLVRVDDGAGPGVASLVRDLVPCKVLVLLVGPDEAEDIPAVVPGPVADEDIARMLELRLPLDVAQARRIAEAADGSPVEAARRVEAAVLAGRLEPTIAGYRLDLDAGDAQSTRLEHLVGAARYEEALALATETYDARAAELGLRAADALALPADDPRRLRLEIHQLTHTASHRIRADFVAPLEALLARCPEAAHELRAILLVHLGRCFAQDPARAVPLLERACEHARAAGSVRWQVWATLPWARALIDLADVPRGIGLLEQVLALPLAPAEHVEALLAASDLALAAGDTARADELNQQAVRLARELGRDDSLARALYVGSVLAFRLRGDVDAALAMVDEAYELHRRNGTATGVAATLDHKGDLLRHLGRAEEGLQVTREGYRWAVAGRVVRMPSRVNLALAYLGVDDLEAAAAVLDEAARVAEDTAQAGWIWCIRFPQLHVAARQGDWPAFDAHLQELQADPGVAEGALPLQAEAAADACLEAGEVDRARKALELAIRVTELPSEAERFRERIGALPS